VGLEGHLAVAEVAVVLALGLVERDGVGRVGPDLAGHLELLQAALHADHGRQQLLAQGKVLVLEEAKRLKEWPLSASRSSHRLRCMPIMAAAALCPAQQGASLRCLSGAAAACGTACARRVLR
jgi:hypothetical protein